MQHVVTQFVGQGKADSAGVHDVGVVEDSPARVGRVFEQGAFELVEGMALNLGDRIVVEGRVSSRATFKRRHHYSRRQSAAN